MRTFLTAIALTGLCHLAFAAPDEDRLGKSQGYPIGTARTWFFDESVRVGSFTAQGDIAGIANGAANVLAPGDAPMALARAAREPSIRWNNDYRNGLGVDDYLSRQRIMGLMIVKDGVIQVERYQYQRRPSHRFLSNSMSKSITSLAFGIALQEGKIKSLDDRADSYAPKLAGTLFGETTIRNLLRMASGARFTEEYDGKDDAARFGAAVSRNGIEAAISVVTEREAPQGARFSYASAQTHALAAVLRGATGMSVSDYLTPRLWQAIGAETSALWRTDRTGLELAGGNFNATLADYARLGVVLANDGVRPDDPPRKQIIPLAYLLEATDWHRVPEAFRPRKATPYYGYGYQFWLFPGEKRRFALLGVYGQMMFVDPELKLVMVQTAANATAKAGQTSLGREADAFWRGVVRQYGNW
ncbi:MAG: class C beta-lactamase-related serine hydrolase [Betaproteobacteria bacterium]|nr:class C beta-lactamase-related serine hydrolase [Betaproteobacteria bacterium]